ncbi:MAG: Hpt domain-containing protein [Candidatus Brocadia sp.]|nr:Hpt domain-containing protein [Candidatus Brocadia sp.]
MKTNLHDIAVCRKEKWQNNEIVFDKDEALEIHGNEEEFVKELAEMFLYDFSDQISLIKEAITCRNSSDLEKAAHKLKGAVANFGKNTVYKAALNLEMMGRENRWDDVQEAYGALTKEAERLIHALRKFVKSK